MVLTLPASEPLLTGYIDPRHPHAVNHIVVDDLGEEEILACVCDDGDVLAYHTSAVFNALERRDPLVGMGYNGAENLRSFLNENVGLSAWGLAVHKASRMIAVSANTKKITVFAFALSSGNVDSEEDDTTATVDDLLEHTVLETMTDTHEPMPFWDTKRGRGKTHSSFSRSQNLQLILEGHKTNISNIAFCNTHDDKEGRWLISTDIDGWMIVWDIFSRTEISRHRISLPPISPAGSQTVWLDRHG